MRQTMAAIAAALLVCPGAGAAELKKGTPEVKSISALAFGPDGVLFIGDAQSASLFAVSTDDIQPSGEEDIKVERIDATIADKLGTTPANIAINDVKVNPASGNVYLAVTRIGAGGGSLIMRLDRAGKLAEFALKDVPFASTKIQSPSEKNKQDVITSLAFVDGKVIIAGLSNEEFSSSLRSIPYPFAEANKPTSVEMFHAAHGKTETASPIRTFVPYKISGADYLLAAYTCTPLVKVAVADLKPGAKIKATTIAELGNRNRPLDMIVYTKDKTDYILMANSARGVMKIPAAPFADAGAITDPVKGGGTAGVKFETIKELTGVMQLDRLDSERALVLVLAEDKTYTLKSIPLP